MFSCHYNTRKFITLVLLIFSATVFSQPPIVDSLRRVLYHTNIDSARTSASIMLGEWFVFDKPDSAQLLWEQAKKTVDEKLKSLRKDSKEYKTYRRLQANYLHDFAFSNDNKGNGIAAAKYYIEAIEIRKELGDTKLYAEENSFLGSVYKSLGNIPKALECFDKCLKAAEQINNKSIYAQALNSIGTVYLSQNDLTTGLTYIERCLEIKREIKDFYGIAFSLANIGTVYSSRGDKSKALDLYRQSQKIRDSIGDKKGEAYALINMAAIYDSYGDPEIKESKAASLAGGKKKALACFKRALELSEQVGNKKGVSKALYGAGRTYFHMKDFSKAISFCSKGLAVAVQTGAPEDIKLASSTLYEAYKETGKHKLALESYELYVKMRDSINNETVRKASIRSQLKYEYEKQAAADSVAHAKATEVKNAELKRQDAELKAKNNQQYALFGGLGLVMIFAGFMYNRFKITQKQKVVIEQQKEMVEMQKMLVEEKQKEIIDSIRYAKKIQLAQIPSEKRVQQMFRKLGK